MQDNLWLHDFAQFINNLNTSSAYPHAKIDSTFYWAWNGNQFQALGLVNAVSTSYPLFLTFFPVDRCYTTDFCDF